MLPPKSNWIEFSNVVEKLNFMKKYNLISPTVSSPKALIYSGGFVPAPVPCILRGYVSERILVIELNGELHCINTSCLAEMQPGFSSLLAPEAYIVLDLETTGLNRKQDKIIEFAAVKYQNGQEIDVLDTLVNPEQSIPPSAVAVSGITDLDVLSAPTIDDVFPAIHNFLSDFPLVVHNKSFDIPVLKALYEKRGLVLDNQVIDTLALARKAYPDLPSHKLETLKDYLGIQISTSHRALPDVYATATLFKKSLSQLFALKTASEQSAPAASPEPVPHMPRFEKTPRLRDIHPTSDHIDPTGPLFGKRIVFTGALNMPRVEAMQLAVNCGAILMSTVSKRTDFLIVGIQDELLVDESGKSTKEKMARSLNDAGEAQIKLLNEEQFLNMTKNEVTI